MFGLGLGQLGLSNFGPAVPPVPISRVGGAVGTNTATVPAHVVGDWILCFGFNGSGTLLPGLPTGFTGKAIDVATGTGCRARLSVFRAIDSSTVIGVLANCTACVVEVYRGVSSIPASGTGGNDIDLLSQTTATYVSTALTGPGATSWVVQFCGAVQVDNATQTPPTGFTFRDTQSGTGKASAHDSNGAIGAWVDRTVALGGTAGGWITGGIELID